MHYFSNEINCASGDEDEQPVDESAKMETFDVKLSVLLDFEGAQCESEPDLIVELIDLYLADVPQQLSDMKNSVLNADEVSFKRAAHTLKGSSANLGVKSIAQICGELERLEFIESLQKINVCLNRLEQAFARVNQFFLAERVKRTNAAN